MKTDNLGRNDLSPGGFVWYRQYLEAMDAKDLELWSSFLADDCTLVINNEAPVTGKSAILMKLQPMWAALPDLEHDLLAILGSDQHFALEALNHYRTGERTATVRAVAVTERDLEGKARNVSLSFDPAPLRAMQGEG